MSDLADPPQLQQILADPRVTGATERRAEHARRAREMQAEHSRYGRLFVWGTCVAAITGALILYGAGGTEVEQPVTVSDTLYKWLSAGWLRAVLFVIQIGGLVLSGYAASYLSSRKSLDEWDKERRGAEAGRIGRMERILAVAAELDAATPGWGYQAAAFDYFLRDQLKGQMAFYRKAIDRGEKGARRTAQTGAYVAAAVASASAAAGLSGVGGDIWLAVAALIGVVAPLLGNSVRSWQDMTLDKEKVDRYRGAWEELSSVSDESGQAQAALAAGDAAPATALMTRVHEVMQSENTAWRPAAPSQ